MSDKPRIVPVIVTDPRVDRLYQVYPAPDGGVWFTGDPIPVPEDDQLRQDLDDVTDWLLLNAPEWAKDHKPFIESAMRLRAAAGLDQEDE